MKPLWQDYHWPVLGILWLAAVGLGYAGAVKQIAALGERRSLWDPIYRAIQLFVLEEGIAASGVALPWEWEVARLLAPALTAYTAVTAFTAVFHEQSQLLRLKFFKNHVVVCGLGQKGLQLATDFHDQGDRVVVIEMDEGNDAIATCREGGIVVLQGDATDQAVLRKARVHRARHLIAICGNDGANVQIAVQAHQLLRETRPSPAVSPRLNSNEGRSARKRPATDDDPSKVHCFVHLVDLQLRTLVRQSRIYTQTDDPLELSFFNIFETSARALLDEFPPDRYADLASDSGVPVMIIGFGETGASVALQAAKIGHYPRGKKLRLTVIDREAEKKAAVFRLRYPGFDQSCEARFLQMDVEDADFLAGKFLQDDAGQCLISAVYVCLGSDALGLSCALTLQGKIKRLSIPIVVCMTQDQGLGALIGEFTHSHQLHAFRMINSTCRRVMILNESQDILARAIHEAYVHKQESEGQSAPENPNLVRWEMLPEEIKDSNRQQADHIAVKLRSVGYSTHPVSREESAHVEFTPEEVELLAEMEHGRWHAERSLAGWSYDPATRDLERKTSPYLVDWDQLPDQIRDYNRHTVREIPAFLAKAGFEIRRPK
ncbi:MAG: NAD-binding protein [Acidobacteriota bacterium]